jgi:hypothetical protein
MAVSSKLMIVDAERRFPRRIKLGIPTGGFGARLIDMHARLDENCGADGWAMTPAGLRGVINDAVAVHFLDAALAAAFVSRWCAGSKVEIAAGAFQVREDKPVPPFKPRRIRPSERGRPAEIAGHYGCRDGGRTEATARILG